MSDLVTPQPIPPTRSAGPNPIALLLVGALVGGISGGAAARYLASPSSESTPPAGRSGASAPIAAPVQVIPAPGSDEVVNVVKELLPTVVTVVNKLPGGQAQSSGSGFVIDAAQGYIVTNNHVVENVRGSGAGAAFDVIFSDDRKVDAKLVGRDPQTDVAVLQVPAQGLKAATLGDSDEVPVGSSVVAIGSALGEFQNTVTTGIVSAKGRRVAETQDVFLEDLIQTDAAINEGNSGGPLIWVAKRQVIGMNTLVARANGSEGLGFAVSSNTIKQITAEIVKNGRVLRGSIGISYTQLSSRAAVQLGLPAGTTGILVSQVLSGSPAERAGIRPSDVITKLNDQQIDAEHPLVSIMVKFRPGDRVRLTLFRDGRQQTVDITLGQPLQ